MINFPTMHIADSVTNRLLNLRDELRTDRQAGAGAARNAPDAPAGGAGGGPGRGWGAGGGSGVGAPGAARNAPDPGMGLGSMLLDQRLATPPPAMALPTDPQLAGLSGMVATGQNLL